MDDLDMLARGFTSAPRGKSNPMRSETSDRRSVDDQRDRDGFLFNDVFGGPPKSTSSLKSNSNNSKENSGLSGFDYDSIFNSSAAAREPMKNNTSTKTSSLPVYDKPIYDEDIFDGLPGLKSKSAAATSVRLDDDVFASMSSPPSSNRDNDFDDLLRNFGRNENLGESKNRTSGAKSSSSSRGFDDLLAGLDSSISAAGNRPIPESNRVSLSTGSSKHGSNVLDDPFVVLESSSIPVSSSSRSFTDPLEGVSKIGKSSSAKPEASSGSGAFDDLDPLDSFGKVVPPFSPGRDNGEKNGSPSRSATPQSATTSEQKGSTSFRYSETNAEKKVPRNSFQEPPLFDVPSVTTDFAKPFGQTASPIFNKTSLQVNMSLRSEGQGQHSDGVWLTVSEIPLFTQPTTAPPPSRPPPPIPRRASRSETGSFSSSLRKKGDAVSAPPNYSQHSHSPKLAQPAVKSPPVSQFDELEDFAMGRSRNGVDDGASFHPSEEVHAFSAAAASAAAMKDAMDKAEAKFRHAKEVREREYARAARNKESVQLEKGEQDGQETEFRETQERLDRERKQKEVEEREQKRLEKERERLREIEREKARQAVERATKEARDRAAFEARERAAAEARVKAEKAAVEKATSEARERAERAAVQRAQTEARERAAAEAKERAEKAAAEAREKEAQDRAAVARAEAEARHRAERAAVERAAAEARGRAATVARERAAAAAKMSQQNNDLESFFSMGRASSAPRAQTNSVDPLFDQQFQSKGGSEASKKTSSSSGASFNMNKASSITNIVDDLSSIFGAVPSSGDFQEVEGETEERRRARIDRHQRTQERAAKALAEKNHRDLQVQREQEERHRISETLDIEIKRWAAGKEGNLRALLSTLQYVLWPECGWQPVSLTDLIMGASVKKIYRKATLCIHPDKVQQKGATLQQKYIAEKVFDLLKEAWNKFNSEELF